MLAFQGICCAGIMVFSYVAVICMPLESIQSYDDILPQRLLLF